jgi:hypothetical protein
MKRERIPDALRFFSAHIVKGFDPTVGQHAVEAQLEALTSMDLSPPAPNDDEDLHLCIQTKLNVASQRDTVRFGCAREPATLEDALPVFERFSHLCQLFDVFQAEVQYVVDRCSGSLASAQR